MCGCIYVCVSACMWCGKAGLLLYVWVYIYMCVSACMWCGKVGLLLYVWVYICVCVCMHVVW